VKDSGHDIRSRKRARRGASISQRTVCVQSPTQDISVRHGAEGAASRCDIADAVQTGDENGHRGCPTNRPLSQLTGVVRPPTSKLTRHETSTEGARPSDHVDGTFHTINLTWTAPSECGAPAGRMTCGSDCAGAVVPHRQRDRLEAWDRRSRVQAHFNVRDTELPLLIRSPTTNPLKDQRAPVFDGVGYFVCSEEVASIRSDPHGNLRIAEICTIPQIA